MPAIRRIALGLLGVVVKCCSAEAQDWGRAVARETDFIESDWSAMRWVLGSATAMCRYSILRQMRVRFRGRKLALEHSAKKLPAVLSGMLAAGGVLAVCLLLLSSLQQASWFEPAHRKLADRLLFVAIPETLYLAGAALLWRHRKRVVAVGILAGGVILIAHAIVHFVTHG